MRCLSCFNYLIACQIINSFAEKPRCKTIEKPQSVPYCSVLWSFFDFDFFRLPCSCRLWTGTRSRSASFTASSILVTCSHWSPAASWPPSCRLQGTKSCLMLETHEAAVYWTYPRRSSHRTHQKLEKRTEIPLLPSATSSVSNLHCSASCVNGAQCKFTKQKRITQLNYVESKSISTKIWKKWVQQKFQKNNLGNVLEAQCFGWPPVTAWRPWKSFYRLKRTSISMAKNIFLFETPEPFLRPKQEMLSSDWQTFSHFMLEIRFQVVWWCSAVVVLVEFAVASGY